MNKFIIVILFCLGLGLLSSISAQEGSVATYRITGTVEDITGHPLPGATVVVKNTTKGVITNLDGQYTIDVAADQNTLVFSFLGMRSREYTINSDQVLNVTLEEGTTAIDEIVITGYQTVDKRTFTGSVSRLDTSQFDQAGVPDVSRMIQGTVAGVAVENTSGTFGSRVKIRIRGNSSISGNQEPLWVIDGVVMEDPVDVDPNQLYSGDPSTIVSSAISGINPNDIEEIQILKDASATAMYGTQAVNGVIVITTKTGKQGRVNVNYDGNYTVTVRPSIYDFNVMNSKERMEFSEELYARNLLNFNNLNSTYGAYGLLLSQLSRKEITWDEFDEKVRQYKLNNTDWFDVLFSNSFIQEHSLSVTTGSDKSQYYFSGSFYDDNGQTLGQYAKRYTGNMRANFDISRRLTLGAILNGSIRDQRIFGTFESETTNGVSSRQFDINPFNVAVNTSRAMRPYDDNGDLEYYKRNFAPFNIIEELENNFMNVDAYDFKLQSDINYKFTPNFNYMGIFSARYSSTLQEHIVTERSNVAQSYRAMDSYEIIRQNQNLYDDPDDENQNPVTVLPRGGILILDNTLARFYTVRNSLNWKPRIRNTHFFDILAGTEFRRKLYDNYYNKGYGFEYYKGRSASPDYLAIKRDLLTDGDSYYYSNINAYNDLAFYSNIAYSYKTLYNVSFSIRSDGSNRLGKSQRFRFLPIWVVGLSWNAHEEGFLQSKSWIDFLKLRTSYGLRGNVGGLGSPSLLAFYDLTSRFNSNDNENILDILSPENPDLQWEKEYMFNGAVEFGFFNRFSGTIEYYNRYNYDLIGFIEVSRVSGFTGKDVNWADMRNEGIEFTLNSSNLNPGNFEWNTIFTFGYNKNTILNAYFIPTVSQATVAEGIAMVGKPVRGLYSFKFAGLNSEGLPEFYDENGEKTMSINRFSRDLGSIKYEGPREPVATGGLTNSFRFRNISASILFTYSYGNKLRLRSLYAYYYNDYQALDKDLAYRWQAPGDEQYTSIPRIIDEETRSRLLTNNADPVTYYNRSDVRVADGSFVRLKNVTLAYAIPNKLVNRIGIQRAQIQAQGQNLYLWADPALKGQDPEAISTGISIPAPTTISMGLKLTF